MLAPAFVRQALYQFLRALQELFVGRSVGAALLDEVVKQLRHLSIKARICKLVPNDRLADVVDDRLGDGVA